MIPVILCISPTQSNQSHLPAFAGHLHAEGHKLLRHEAESLGNDGSGDRGSTWANHLMISEVDRGGQGWTVSQEPLLKAGEMEGRDA